MYDFVVNIVVMYVKPKKWRVSKIMLHDKDLFIAYIKTEDIYVDISKDVETRFDTLNYELDRPLPKGKKRIGLMKDELGWKIIKEFAALRAKTYSYLRDNNIEDKKAKGTKKCKSKNMNLKIVGTVQKQVNLRIKQTNQKKINLMWVVLEKIIYNKEYIKNKQY